MIFIFSGTQKRLVRTHPVVLWINRKIYFSTGPKRKWDVFYQVSFGQSGPSHESMHEYKAYGFGIMYVVFDLKQF